MNPNVNTIQTPINLDHFEIIKTGTGFFPAVTTSDPGAGNFVLGHASTSVTHNLGYTPTLLAFLSVVSNGRTYPMPLNVYQNNTAAKAAFLAFELYADSTNVNLLTDIVAYGGSFSVAAQAYQAQYYLLRERIRRIS